MLKIRDNWGASELRFFSMNDGAVLRFSRCDSFLATSDVTVVGLVTGRARCSFFRVSSFGLSCPRKSSRVKPGTKFDLLLTMERMVWECHVRREPEKTAREDSLRRKPQQVKTDSQIELPSVFMDTGTDSVTH